MEQQFVYLPVPADKAGEVYRFLADLEIESQEPSDEQPIESDRELYRRMYFDSHPNHRQLLLFFARHHGRSFTTEEVATALNLDSGARGAGGMFGAFGRRAKNRYGSRTPWRTEWDSFHQVARHMMDRPVALIISEAALEAGDASRDDAFLDDARSASTPESG